MSFELKPQQRIGITTDVRTIVWTLPRNRLPVHLEGRGVSLDMWMATFDATVEPYLYLLGNFGGTKSLWMLVPCLLCCSIPVMIQARQTYEQMWVDLAQKQSDLYRPYDVQVTVAKEIQSTGAGSHRGVTYEMVGLRFEVAPPRMATAVAVMAPPSVPPLGVSEQLVQLDDLFQTGALTADEYTRAKAHVLKSIP